MALNSKQKAACELMVAKPELSYEEVASEIGVSDVTLWRWRQKAEWRDYEHELCHQRFMDLERLAVRKLKENVSKNNQKAIEYALDYAGYKAATKLEAEVSTDIEINITE